MSDIGVEILLLPGIPVHRPGRKPRTQGGAVARAA